MPAWLWPVISGIASVAGDAFGVHEARRAASRTEELSNTAVQRRVKDLKAAGLNPGLAYESQASSPTIQSGASSDAGSRSVTNASSAMRLRSELDLIKAQVEAQKASAEAQRAQAGKANIEAEKVGTELAVIGAGEYSYRDEVMARRAAAMRDLQFAGTLQPFQRQLAESDAMLRGAQYQREKYGLSRAEFLSSALETPNRIMNWMNSGLSRFQEARGAFDAKRSEQESYFNRFWLQERLRTAERMRRLREAQRSGSF